MADLEEYFAELDHAWQRITERDGHTQVILSGHSTGGLVVALWADARKPEELAGIVLNSPWLDLQGKAWMRTPPATAVIDRIGRLQPMRIFPRDGQRRLREEPAPRPRGRVGLRPDLEAARVLSRPASGGSARSAPATPGCTAGSTSTARSWSSRRTARSSPRALDENAHTTDIVLDVKQIRRWAGSLGSNVTSIAVPGAVHDVVLSRPKARERAYAEIQRWLSTYVL